MADDPCTDFRDWYDATSDLHARMAARFDRFYDAVADEILRLTSSPPAPPSPSPSADPEPQSA